MPQMTPSQARVVDAVLTSVAQGYKNAELIGNALFPYVPVGQRGGKIISFGKEDFALYATGRVPGSNTRRINFGYSSDNYALESHSLEGQVPIELLQEANAVPGMNLGTLAVNKVQAIIGLRLEAAQAALATKTGNYAASNKTALTGTDQWSHEASLPCDAIEEAKEVVRQQVGRRPNTIVLGAAVLAKLKNNKQITDRIKYTGRDVPTPELLASLFGVARVVVGDAVYTGADGKFADVWGKNVVLAYTELGPLADQGVPTFGYTYRLNGYPLVEQTYFDRNSKSWIYPVTDEVSPVIAGASAGYLISNAVA